MVFNHGFFTNPVQCRHDYSLAAVGLNSKGVVDDSVMFKIPVCLKKLLAMAWYASAKNLMRHTSFWEFIIFSG